MSINVHICELKTDHMIQKSVIICRACTCAPDCYRVIFSDVIFLFSEQPLSI